MSLVTTARPMSLVSTPRPMTVPATNHRRCNGYVHDTDLRKFLRTVHVTSTVRWVGAVGRVRVQSDA
jgi:hypothetical protein